MKLNLALVVTLSAVLWGGCAFTATSRQGDAVSNIYRAASRLPPHLRRVAVLPVTVAQTDLVAEIGRDDLEPLLHAELRKADLFEVVLVSREQLRDWTGQTEWTARQELPDRFFERLRAVTSCDAVMFCELTHYKPYTPVSIGWDIKLVDSTKTQILWAVDEMFDAGDGATVSAARHYYAQHFRAPDSLADSWSILESPRRFAQYTASAVLATLPAR